MAEGKMILHLTSKKGLGRSHEVDIDSFLKGFPLAGVYLSREEEQVIAALPKDDQQRWKLVEHNIRFAIKHANSVYNRNKIVNDYASLLSVCVEALYEASRGFKPVGTKFTTYSTYWLRRNTRAEVHRQVSVLKLPSLCEANRGRLREDMRYETPLNLVEFSGSDHRDPEIDQPGISDDIILCSGLSTKEHERTEDKSVNNGLQEDLIKIIKEKIPLQRNRDIIIKSWGLFGEPVMTNGELAKHFNLTLNSIVRIKREIFNKLRKSPILKEYIN